MWCCTCNLNKWGQGSCRVIEKYQTWIEWSLGRLAHMTLTGVGSKIIFVHIPFRFTNYNDCKNRWLQQRRDSWFENVVAFRIFEYNNLFQDRIYRRVYHLFVCLYNWSFQVETQTGPAFSGACSTSRDRNHSASRTSIRQERKQNYKCISCRYK